MPQVRFGKTVETIAKEILEPSGFRTVQLKEPGYAPFFSFVKPWKAGLELAIGVQARVGKPAFTVELGVIPEGGNFYEAAPFEMGPWRKVGLRVRLDKAMEASKQNAGSSDRAFFAYENEDSLTSQLRRALGLALEYGPATWEKLGSRLR